MIASHNVLTQIVNIRPGINSLVTRVYLVELIDMYPSNLLVGQTMLCDKMHFCL